MKFRTTITIIIVLIINFFGNAHADTNSIKTRYGTLHVITEEGNTDTKRILVLKTENDYKEILKIEEQYIYIESLIKLQSEDIVFIDITTGGSGTTPSYSVVALGPNKSVKYFNNDLSSGTNTFRPIIHKNLLIIDLGFEEKKHKQAVYDGKNLYIEYDNNMKFKLERDDLQFLYEVYEQCSYENLRQSTHENRKTICRNPTQRFAMVYLRSLFSTANHPDFNETEFDKLCINLCNSGNVINFESFSQRITNNKN